MSFDPYYDYKGQKFCINQKRFFVIRQIIDQD